MAKGAYLGEFEQIVMLALLRLGEHAYGMIIRREIEETTGRQVSIGAVYATLDRLERKDFITSRVGEASARRGGRAKRYFQLTAAGNRVLQSSREMLRKMWDGVETSLVEKSS